MVTKRHTWLMSTMMALCVSLPAGPVAAAELDPTAITIRMPEKIAWKRNAEAGNESAILFGDPAKPGLYIQLVRWLPGHMSHPHFHPHDRYITVISGTWWVGTGTHFDPAATVAVPAGSFVTHFGKQVHYDGAKEGETILQIIGEGPGSSAPAEDR